MKRLLPLLPLLWCLRALPAPASPTPFGAFGVRGPAATGASSTLPVRWRGEAQAAPAAPVRPAPAAKAPARLPAGAACRADAECTDGTYCDDGVCAAIQPSINILYLFYRSQDRRFTEVMGIYYHQRGDEGYRVVFPFYWHFWNQADRTKVFFPFYFRYDAPTEGVTSTFVLPFQFRRTPTEKNYRFWPLVFWTDYGDRGSGLTIVPLFHRSREGTRDSTVLPLLLTGYNRDPALRFSRGLVGGLYYWHTRGDFKSRALIPFFYHSSSPGRSFNWVLPLNFYARSGEDRTLFLAPLLYHSRTRTASRWLALVPPLYSYSEGDRRTLAVLPLFYDRRDAESRTLLTLPLTYYHREPGSARFFAAPCFYYRRDGDNTFFLGGPFYRSTRKGGGSLGLLPIYFQGRDGDSSYRVFFPLYWQLSGPDRSFVVGGPFFYRRNGQRTTAGLIPVAFYHHDREAGEKHGLVLPFFYYGSEGHGARARVASPLFFYGRDDDAKVKHWGLVVPPYYHRRDAERSIDVLFPLAMRWRDHLDRSTTWVIGPFVWSSDPEGGAQVLFPLFWRFTDAKSGAATSILFPLAFRHVRPDRSHLNLFFPFFYRRTSADWSAGVLPLIYAGASPGRRHVVFFPAFWHVKTPAATTTVLGPLFHQRLADGWRAGIAPLLFAGREGQDSYQVLFPALWHLRSRSEGFEATVIGPAFWTRGRKGRAYGVLPLFAAGTWRGTEFQTVLPPLFYRTRNDQSGEHGLLVGPYYRWGSPGVVGHALFPLFLHERRGSLTRTALLPLFYMRQRPGERLIVTPLGGLRVDEKRGVREGIVGPFAFHRGPDARGFAVVPLLYHWRRPKLDATTTVILPLGVRHTSPKLDALVWFPFLWKFTAPRERSLVVFPLFWRLRQDGGTNADVVFPLFWSVRSPRRQLHIAGPAFWHRRGDRLSAGIVPLGTYYRDSEGSTLLTLPFVYHRHRFAAQQRTTIVGPFYLRRYADGHAAGVFPLVFEKSRPDSKYAIVAPLYWDVSNPETQSRTIFAGPFFYRRKLDARGVGLAPILYAGWDRGGGRTAAFLPIFYYRREIARRAIYTPLFGYDRSPDRTQLYGGVYYRRRSPTSAIDLAVPLFVRYVDKLKGETSLHTMPFYHGRWSVEASFHLVFPLVWRSRRIDSTSTVVFPFVWDFNDRFSSRTTIAFPLMFRHRDHLARSTSWGFLPGVWVRSSSRAIDVLLFPWLWHFGGKQRSTSVIVPLYWDFKRPASRTTIVFPIFWRFDRPEHRRYIVLNSYYIWNKKDSTYNYHFIPLFQLQRKRPGDFLFEILGGLAGYERIGRNRFLKLFFYSFALEPTGGKTLSGFGGKRNVSWAGTYD